MRPRELSPPCKSQDGLRSLASVESMTENKAAVSCTRIQPLAGIPTSIIPRHLCGYTAAYSPFSSPCTSAGRKSKGERGRGGRGRGEIMHRDPTFDSTHCPALFASPRSRDERRGEARGTSSRHGEERRNREYQRRRSDFLRPLADVLTVNYVRQRDTYRLSLE